MGISGDPKSLLHIDAVKNDNIPVIKRFSGGGTVIVDENTLFISFIMNKQDVDTPPFPEPILRWSTDLYSKAWNIPNFHLRENDYCIGDKKCGGNAQYIKKDRWLHHTSFLWQFHEDNMRYLQLPARRPKYRLDRDHRDFLTPLKEHDNIETLIEKFITNVKPLYITDFDLTTLEEKPHRKATQFIQI